MSLTVTFYMRGGHTVVARMVKLIEMKRDAQTASFVGYTLEFEDGHKPALFALSIADIVAVVASSHESPPARSVSSPNARASRPGP